MHHSILTLLPAPPSDAVTQNDEAASPRLRLVPPGQPTTSPGHYRGHLLIVAADLDAREDLAGFLRQRGYRVWVAATTSEARAMIAHRQPDLVLLDLDLPLRSGATLIRTLRQQPGTALLPIIIVSARHAPHDIRDGLALGADDYLTKPLELSLAEARINALLRREARARLAFATEQWSAAELAASLN